ncbi:Trifunctional nucleotide phosphoesterase protein YfkN [Thalassocella blandensis]|nr:Trifunctional nucleotide phosphoesterase protein YfkN [Thalassocella blandensis]
MNGLQVFSLLTIAILLSACSGDDGKNGANSLISQTAIAAGSDACLYGGVRIDSGLDSNRNGELEADEITDSETLCDQEAFELQLLHFADVDGGRDIINNAVRFSALLNTFKSEFNNTVVLSSGDNWIPGPEYNVASDDALASILGVPGNGRAHVAYLNALGVQATVFGNHEFDMGTEEVAALISAEQDGENMWPGAKFPYLSANLDFSTDSALASLIGTDGAAATTLKNKVAASTVISVGGQRVGVVGATTPTLRSISSPGDISVLPEDSADVAALAAEIQPAVDALTAEGINKIILLAHMQQIAVEQQLAPLLSDVDIIVAGGSNTILADANDRLRDGDVAVDDYPLQYSSADGEPVLVVNTDGDYTYLGRLVVTFDKRGILIPVLMDDQINGAYAADETGLVEQGLSWGDAIDDVADISATLTDALQAKAGNIVGRSSVYLNGERVSVRTEETNLGNLTAQANLYYAQQADPSVSISIKNGGGIRASIGSCIVPPGSTGGDDLECGPPAGVEGISQAGDISQLDLEIALRFNNSLSFVTLTGPQLKEILEHGVAASGGTSTPGQFAQVAGVRFTYDVNQTGQTVTGEPPVVDSAGMRIRSLTVLDDNGAGADGDEVIVVEDGELVAGADSMTFRVVTLGYLAEGGDGYPFPSDMAANVVDMLAEGVQTGNATFADDGTEQDALAEYLLGNFPADDNEATPVYSDADTPADQDLYIQPVM